MMMQPIASPSLAAGLRLPQFGAKVKMKLDEGTPIRLQFVTGLNSQVNRTGDFANLQVAEDITNEDGDVLVRSGTPATAMVMAAEERGRIGKPGSLLLNLHSTKAVDGNKVMLVGTQQTKGKDKRVNSVLWTGITTFLIPPFSFLFLLMRGKHAEIPAGAQIQAYTARDTMVNVEVDDSRAASKKAAVVPDSGPACNSLDDERSEKR